MQVIAIIPTFRRPKSLLRAVQSVIFQSKQPDYLIVVHEPEDGVEVIDSGHINFHVTENTRSKSLSGAINHALDEVILHRHEWNIEPEQTWLALLDDDDWWDESYIERCMTLAQGDVQQVVAGMRRYDVNHPEGFPLSIPTTLQVDSFLVKNPHIQGSNLFVRMDSFLEAGGFDEALQSCTDRDVCIRLFERPQHQWARLDAHLVHHDARNTGRISDHSSVRKREGLTRFAMKHQFRMDDSTWREFSEVAKERFGISIECDVVNTKNQHDENLEKYVEEHLSEPFELTIAVTLSDLDLTKQFVASVSPITDEWPWKVRLVICLYQLCPDDVGALLSCLKHSSVEVILHEESWGHQLAEEGELGPWFLNQDNRSGISWGRCVLHRAALDAVLTDRRPAIWIVDEDMKLGNGCWSLNGTKCSSGSAPLKEAIAFMYKSNIDVGVGHIIGDPPLPSLYTQRTQLVDLHHAQLKNSSENGWRIRWSTDSQRDMHHDLASHRWDHLEFPWGLNQASSTEVDEIESVMLGKSRTRLVHDDWTNRCKDDLIFRGGNTLILDPHALNEWSNVAPNVGGIQLRRGDSMWALWAQRIRGLRADKEFRNVDWIPFALPQYRINGHSLDSSVNNIRGDILASMLLRELEVALPLGAMEENRQSTKSNAWYAGISERTLQASKRRESRLIANLFRIRQLASLLGKNGLPLSTFNELWASQIPTEVCDGLEVFFSEFEKNMVNFRSAQPKPRPGHQVEKAWKLYLEHGGSTDAIVVGHGSGGVVFRENKRATKVLHDGIRGAEEHHVLFNKSLLQRKNIACLPNNLIIERYDDEILVHYDWVEGKHPTMQTSVRPWLELLRLCRENELVFWDLKPQNLIFTKEGRLVIIDLDRNLKTFSEHAWKSMVRKAYLCWRHWNRADLRALLTLSLRETEPASLPELEGIEWFSSSIEISNKSELHDPWFIEILQSQAPGRLLDWGCGCGQLTKKIANLGYNVDAYDPISKYKRQVNSHHNINWIDGTNFIPDKQYDAVVSTLVLCVIEDDNEALQVLTILRSALKPDGRAFVSVCHPDYLSTRCSTSIERPEVKLISERVSYEKLVRSTGRKRIEHTRSTKLIESLATAAGLKLVNVHNSPGIDIDKCTPISEYITMEFELLGVV